MAKKNSRNSATENLATSYFTVKRTRRHAVPLSSKQVPMKIEGVRKHRSKWAAEIKHPKKKNVRIWLGSYATQEEASKVYLSKKMEHEEIKIQAAAEKDKELIDDQEIVGLFVDRDFETKGIDFDDRDVAVNVFEFDDQGMGVSDFNAEKTGRYSVPLPSKKQVPIKIEGVRMKRSRWVAEIKHPKKKNVRIWLGSHATQEEASKVYQLKKMEHEKLKLQAIAEKDKLVGDQEVVGAHVEPNAESLSGDPDVIHSDDQAERSLSLRRLVEQEAGDMLLQLGPISIDRYGYLLGEFSWMDDLSIV